MAVFGQSTASLINLASRVGDLRSAYARLLLDLAVQLRLLAGPEQPLRLEHDRLAKLAEALLQDHHDKVSIATRAEGRSKPFETAKAIRQVLDRQMSANPVRVFERAATTLQPLLAEGLVAGLENHLGASLTTASREAIAYHGHASTVATAMVARQAAVARESGNSAGLTAYLNAQLSRLDLYQAIRVPTPPAPETATAPQLLPNLSADHPGGDVDFVRRVPIADTRAVDLGKEPVLPATPVPQSETKTSKVPVAFDSYIHSPSLLPGLHYTYQRNNFNALPPTLMVTHNPEQLKSLWSGIAATLQPTVASADLVSLKKAIAAGWYPTASDVPFLNVVLDEESTDRLRVLYLDLMNAHPPLTGHVKGLLGLMVRAGLADAEAVLQLAQDLDRRKAILVAAR